MLSNISNIVQIIAIFQLLLLSYIVISDNYKVLNNRILFLFLILNTILLIASYVYKNEFISRNDYPIIFFLIRSSFLILGPLLLFYVKSKCYSNLLLRKSNWVHLISFGAIFLFFLAQYYFRKNLFHVESLESFNVYDYLAFQVFWSFFLVQLLVYIILSYRTLIFYRKSLKYAFSNTEELEFQYLHVLLGVYVLHWFFDALPPIFYVSGIFNSDWYTLAGIFSTVTLLTFTTFVVIKGVKRSNIFSAIDEKPKYADSPLTENESEEYLKLLTNYVENSKPYLDPNLKLTDISSNLGIPEKQISQLLNQIIGKNFFDFINGYRINEVQNHITNNESNGSNKTLLEIAFMSGFNSKTAFNRAFKKITGKTPSQYKSLLSQ